MSTVRTYKHAGRPLTVTTPLGADALALVGFAGSEGMSELFRYNLDLIAPNHAEIAFDKLLGRKATVNLELDDGEKRHFNGIVQFISQGRRDEAVTHYRIELVPGFWLLTKTVRSRIFQRKTVVDILKDVFKEHGLDVIYKLQGAAPPREYCTQYRESDFDFTSRLMQEEGIFYFFQHTADGHKMVVGNASQSSEDLPYRPKLIYEEVSGGNRPEGRIHDWEKAQEVRSGKITLWDHSFELPHKHLETEKSTPDNVRVGRADHKLRIPGNDKLEIYDYPGEYAKRFDGVNKSGGAQASDLQKIFSENARTAGIRMQQEIASALQFKASGDCREPCPGYRFTLEGHFNSNGKYLLTSVRHTAAIGVQIRAGEEGQFDYSNTFTCIPADAVFRPARTVARPRVDGCQTAVVVGPPGEEIFTDQYGRVKVQFHWDRDGKRDADSSCWVRVATLWAGKQWGVVHIPRIGQEVVVDFLEGDPDRPIIVGSVYNAETMPPYTLPGNKTQSGVKSRSSVGGGPDNCNEIRFEDKIGSEQLFVHAEKDSRFETENDRSEWVGHDEEAKVDNDRKRTVGANETISIGGNRSIDVGKNHSLDAKQKIDFKAGQQITLETGASKIVMKSDGQIEISGVKITIKGVQGIESSAVTITSDATGIHIIKGSLVKIN